MKSKMMNRLSLMTVLCSIVVGSVVFPMCLLAQSIGAGMQGHTTTTAILAQPTVTATLPPTATVSLNAGSNCSVGVLDISITTPIAIARQYGIATDSTGAVLGEFELPAAPITSYTGAYSIPFNSVPNGTIVTVYGYAGQTPPNAKNTAEFSASYRCDTDRVFAKCAGPYGPCARVPEFPALNGRWFRLNAVAKGSYVDKGNGVIKPHNVKVPLYMGFVWNAGTNLYDVSVYTQNAPDVWAKTYTTSKLPPGTFTQSYFTDLFLHIHANNGADFFETFHTTYIKFVLDKTGALKAATYSGSGEVLNGSFNGAASQYYGSVSISGVMVSASTLPFTP